MADKKRFFYIAIVVSVAAVLFGYYRLDLSSEDEFEVARAEMVEYLQQEKNITEKNVLR